MTVIRKELLRNDRERERKKWERSLQRRDNLVVCAPADGQLSFVKVTPGQQVSSGENIAEVKVMDQFKIPHGIKRVLHRPCHHPVCPLRSLIKVNVIRSG